MLRKNYQKSHINGRQTLREKKCIFLSIIICLNSDKLSETYFKCMPVLLQLIPLYFK